MLSGKAHYGSLSGLIRYNGQQMEPLGVKTLVGYVPQDDIVHEDLTVHENIMMAYSLRGGFNELRDGKAIVNEVSLSQLSKNELASVLYQVKSVYC